MKLLDNWKEVLGGAWSVWLSALAAIVAMLGALDAVPFVPAQYAQWASAVLAALVIPARIILQVNMSAWLERLWASESGALRRKATVGAATLAAVMALAVPITGKWEGMRTEAYRDVVGVWTVCAGETRGVRPGDSYTVDQCQAMLETRLLDYYEGVRACAPELAAAPAEVQAAVTSWTYNVGIGAACGSTLAKRLRVKDWRGACDQLPRWNRAGGRVWKGLINRRADERGLCLSGLT